MSAVGAVSTKPPFDPVVAAAQFSPNGVAAVLPMSPAVRLIWVWLAPAGKVKLTAPSCDQPVRLVRPIPPSISDPAVGLVTTLQPAGSDWAAVKAPVTPVDSANVASKFPAPAPALAHSCAVTTPFTTCTLRSSIGRLCGPLGSPLPVAETFTPPNSAWLFQAYACPDSGAPLAELATMAPTNDAAVSDPVNCSVS